MDTFNLKTGKEKATADTKMDKAIIFGACQTSSVNPQSFCQEMLTALLRQGISKETISKTVRTSIPTINRLLKYTTVNPSPRLFSRLLSFYLATHYSEGKKINC